MKYTDKPNELNYCLWLEANARRIADNPLTNAGADSFHRRIRRSLREAGLEALEPYACQQINDLAYHYRSAARYACTEENKQQKADK